MKIIKINRAFLWSNKKKYVVLEKFRFRTGIAEVTKEFILTNIEHGGYYLN